ncbi:MAG: hypothetical protein M1274_07030 [Actinobacteria bacterium]|nr:hypothetical protein [Actinomycetota bacterium]
MLGPASVAVPAPVGGRATTERILTVLAVVGCFFVLAWLNGRHVTLGAGHIAIYTIVGIVLFAVGLLAVAAVNMVADSSTLGRSSFTAIWGAVGRGFLTFLPFTLLSLLAELAYKWHAAPAFIQASITTAGAAAGVELMRHFAPKSRYLIVSMMISILFSIIWTLFGYVFARVVG